MSQNFLHFDKALPVLVIDPNGEIGSYLAFSLSDFVQTVLVSKKLLAPKDNLLVINFTSHIENIPNDKYSTIFFIALQEQEIDDYFLSFLEKAKIDQSELICITKSSNFKKNKHIFDRAINFRLILFDDVFGNPNFGSKIDDLLKSAKQIKRIKLENMGGKILRPIYFLDLIDEIINITFNRTERFFVAFQETKITALGVVHAIQKIDPDLKVDFAQQENQDFLEDLLPEESKFVLDQSYPIFKKIQDFYKNINPNSEVKKNDNLYIETAIKNKSKNSIFMFLILFFLSFIIMPLVIFVLSFISSVTFASESSLSLLKRDFKSASYLVQIAYDSSSLSKSSLMLFEDEVNLIGFNNVFYFLDLYENNYQNYLFVLNNLSSVNFYNNPAQLIIEFADNYFLVNATTQKFIFLPYFPQEIKIKINNFYDNYSNILNVLSAVPQIMGDNGKKIYLILFENNAELRPGGGFIGSYALVSFNDGNLKSFKVNDVYNADGLLKGHIEPPFALRRYLPTAHLYLRDSNFDPDFTIDAYEAAFIFKQETGISVNGVFAINETAIENILKATGPIYLPSYNLSVDASNFFITTEKASEKNFFPGSSQKKSFLENFFRGLTEKVLNSKLSFYNLLISIFNNIKDKDILFAFSNANLQNLFSVNNLSSVLSPVGLEDEQTINDFVGVSEANLGVNKANYFVKRSMEYNFKINNNASISGMLTINLANNSSAWPGGDYKNYVRFILPNDALLIGVKINGINENIVPAITDATVYEKKSFVPPSGLEVDKQMEGDKVLYGFLTVIPKAQKQNIVISYVLNQKIDLTSPVINYSLYFYKQPGVSNFPLVLKISFPSSYDPLSYPKNVKINNSILELNQNINFDQKFNFSFRKN